MNDFLRYMSMDSVYRKHHQDLITFSLMYAFSENFVLVLSHDEVVHGKCSMIEKCPGTTGKNLLVFVPAMVICMGILEKLLFMGGEFAQFIEWNYKQSLDWFLLDYDMHKNANLRKRP